MVLFSRSFLYPTDLQLELEYWAETGEYDTDELHEVNAFQLETYLIENYDLLIYAAR